MNQEQQTLYTTMVEALTAYATMRSGLPGDQREGIPAVLAIVEGREHRQLHADNPEMSQITAIVTGSPHVLGNMLGIIGKKETPVKLTLIVAGQQLIS